MMQEPICQIYKTGSEDVFHALMECKTTRKIWKCTHLEDGVNRVIKEDMMSVFHRLMKTLAKIEID